jgi:hypothetical protein
MQPKQQPQRTQLRIELPNNLQVTYGNAAIVNQTHSEIILDFLQIMPNDPRARIQARVVMTPANAKLFLQALQQNLDRFEEKHGKIDIPPRPVSLADELFSTLKSDDDDESSPNGEA